MCWHVAPRIAPSGPGIPGVPVGLAPRRGFSDGRRGRPSASQRWSVFPVGLCCTPDVCRPIRVPGPRCVARGLAAGFWSHKVGALKRCPGGHVIEPSRSWRGAVPGAASDPFGSACVLSAWAWGTVLRPAPSRSNPSVSLGWASCPVPCDPSGRGWPVSRPLRPASRSAACLSSAPGSQVIPSGATSSASTSEAKNVVLWHPNCQHTLHTES